MECRPARNYLYAVSAVLFLVLAIGGLLAVLSVDIACHPADSSAGPDAGTFAGRVCADYGIALYSAILLAPLTVFAVLARRSIQDQSFNPALIGAAVAGLLLIFFPLAFRSLPGVG